MAAVGTHYSTFQVHDGGLGDFDTFFVHEDGDSSGQSSRGKTPRTTLRAWICTVGCLLFAPFFACLDGMPDCMSDSSFQGRFVLPLDGPRAALRETSVLQKPWRAHRHSNSPVEHFSSTASSNRPFLSILDRTAGRAFKKCLGSMAFSGCVDGRGFCLSPPSAEILRRKTKARFGGQIGLNLFC